MNINESELAGVKPYIIRGIYEWMMDTDIMPFIAVHVDNSVDVPMNYVKDNQIIFNISPSAIQRLEITNYAIDFNARFNGLVEKIHIPMDNVKSIFSNNTPTGFEFVNSSTKAQNTEFRPQPHESRSGAIRGKGKPTLTIVK